jgi:SNF2 family DNA or RNA helicase
MQVQRINNHFVFQPKDLALCQAFFPDLRTADVKGSTYAAVPATMEYAQVLSNLHYTVASPINEVYTWPGRFKPYAHQRVTSEFITLNRRAFILNDMGTGKTMSMLWALDFLMKLGFVHKVLIVAPLSCLERVWGDEIFKNLTHRKFAVLHGTAAKRKELLAQKVDFYIINHDGIMIVEDILKQRPDIDCVVVDELRSFHNVQSRRWKCMNGIIKSKPNAYVYGMTGSPTPNAPTDAYGQSKLIKPENFNGAFTAFRNITMQQFGPFRWVPRKGSENVVSQALRPSIRYELRDCIDLPETIYQTRQAELSPQQHKHYLEIKKQASTIINGTEVNAVNAAVLLSKLIQAACGVIYGNSGEVIELDFGPRLAVLKEVIDEAARKVIVFVPFTGILHALERELSKRWSCAIVEGDVGKAKRNDIFLRFQEQKDPQILIAHPQCMSHGLNLTAADTVIWYAPIYSRDIVGQANARHARAGQKEITNIIEICATPAERGVYEALRQKGDEQQRVLDLVRGVMR